MEVAEYYLSLGSAVADRSAIKRALSCISIAIFLGFIAFVSVSVSKFIGSTLSITLSEPENTTSDQSIVEVVAKKGDTLSKILSRQNISYKDASTIIASLQKTNIPAISIGQKFIFAYEVSIAEGDGDEVSLESQTLSQLTIEIDKARRIEVLRNADGWEVQNLTVPLKKVLTRSNAVINNSFLVTAKALGLSANNILELINAYSYHVDFQRQIKSGDKVTFITEQFFTEDGKFSHNGKVVFASMKLSGKDYNIYGYTQDNNDKFQYFSEDGRSVRRNLLRTPVNIMKVSSNFGSRKDPIMGFTKMHKGVDFAAPVGTPIYAAGAGVVTEIGWRSGYGKFIQIKHSPTLSTAYAHASHFTKNLKKGSRVSQGQVIAYVGRTGRTTGAHLHYEVKVDGKHVNPMSIKTTPGVELKASARAKFEKFKNEIHALGNQLSKSS
jgi:murein DD-endopeptidase MepM/ murein hydrolase activator NlpD